jgi:hypothetical protein
MTTGTAPTQPHQQSDDDTFAEHPELYVGAAFAGGFVLAQLLKWIRR